MSFRRAAPAFVPFFLAALAAAQTDGTPVAKAYPDDAGIRAILARRIDDEKLGVGAVVGIVDAAGTRIVTHGKSRKGDGARPLDADTVFEIGSITKVFTGILLTDMARRGEVALDDVLSVHLPAGTAVPRRAGKEITLVSLATHTSGLPRMPQNFAPKDPDNPYADYSVADLYAFLGACDLATDVGTVSLYSNVGYGVLGHVLARRAECSYEELVQRRILGPLGMTDTAITLGESMRERFAQGHDEQLRPVSAWDLGTFAGAGGLRSTTTDVLRFLAANLGLVDAGELRAVLDQSRELTIPIGPKGAARASLAWGGKTMVHGTRIVWHNGGTGGFRTFAGFDPAARRGVVVLTNSSRSFDDIGFHLLEPKARVDVSRAAVVLPRAALDALVGVYEIAPGEHREVLRYRDRLFLRRGGQPWRELLAASPTQFFGKPDFEVRFELAAGGRATNLVVVSRDGEPSPAKRVELSPGNGRRPVEVDVAGYDGLVGGYALATGAVLTITRDGERLLAQIAGQSALEVFPESADRFFVLEVDASLAFTRDGEGQATQLVLRQGGLEQTASRTR